MNLRLSKVILMLLASFVVSSTLAAVQKTAVIDFRRAIFSSEVAKTRFQQMQQQTDFSALQASYDGIAADAKALQKEIESKSMTLSKEQAADYRKKMEYYKADMELAVRKLQAEDKALQNSILRELQPKAEEALKELVKEAGITLLLNAEAAIIVSPEQDLTAKLTDRLNKKTR